MKIKLTTILAFLFLAIVPSYATDRFAALNGSSSGDGSIMSPWDMTTALNAKGAVIQPGDTLYLRNGVYRSPGPYIWWPNLKGAPGNPIFVRPYPGEHAALDFDNFADSFILDNLKRSTPGGEVHDVEFWGVEFFSSDIGRSTSQLSNNGMPNQLMVAGEDIKFVHCYIHDIGNFLSSQLAKNMEAYGNIVLDIGWNAPDRGHGHAFYIENDGANGSVKNYENNFAGSSYDALVQEFGTSALTQNILFKKNTLFDGGAPLGIGTVQFMIGQNRPKGIVVNGNYFFVSDKYSPGNVQNGWQWDGQNHDIDVEDNYVIGPDFEVGNWDNAIIKRNHVFSRNTDAAVLFNTYSAANPPQSVKNWLIDNNEYGAGILKVGSRHVDNAGTAISDGATGYTDLSAWKTTIGGDVNSTYGVAPHLAVQIVPSTKIPGRIHITVWNPASLATVPVDLSAVTDLHDGDAYQLMDAQNFNGPAVLSGRWNASSPVLTVPSTVTARKALIGATTPSHTAPKLLTFVLLAGKALDGSWTPVAGAAIPPPNPVPVPTPVPVGGPMVVNSFTANPASLSTAGTVALSWNISGVSTLTLTSDQGGQFGLQPLVKTTGQLTVNATTVFTLTGSDNSTAKVTVIVGGVAPPPPPAGHNSTLKWTASTSTGATGYNIYRSVITGGPYTKLNATPIAAVTYVDSAVTQGTKYYYVVTAVGLNIESAYSAEGSGTIPTDAVIIIPPPPPATLNPPTGLTVQTQ